MQNLFTTAFSLVTGYVDRAYRKERDYYTVNPDGTKSMTDTAKRLEITMRELDRLWDEWSGYKKPLQTMSLEELHKALNE